MSPRPRQLVVISGMSGVVGSGLTAELLPRLSADVALAGLFRSPASYARAMAALPIADAASRILPVYGDLAKAGGPDDCLTLPAADATIGVHCAADVAWDKTLPEVYDLNVAGSLRFARSVAANSPAARLIYVSSAYTRAIDWTYRNAYEESKAAGERAIADACPTLDLTTFSCSLVIGDSRSGAIGRFHGLYPLIKLIATMGPPFLVGRPDCLIDLVPIDWVARELAEQTLRLIDGDVAAPVVAAAGLHRIELRRMIALIEERINRFRLAHGLPCPAPLTLLPFRRWAFLRRSLEKWRPPELPVQDFRYFERLLDVYKSYTEDDKILPPERTQSPAPEMEPVLLRSVDYWLEQNATLVLSKLRRATKSASLV